MAPLDRLDLVGSPLFCPALWNCLKKKDSGIQDQGRPHQRLLKRHLFGSNERK
jgi:hypothetical protein